MRRGEENGLDWGVWEAEEKRMKKLVVDVEVLCLPATELRR
jgi:hypothetical protein